MIVIQAGMNVAGVTHSDELYTKVLWSSGVLVFQLIDSRSKKQSSML
jgi:hypothetical protein